MSDLRQEHMDLLGEEFGKVYHAVWTEWCSGLVRYEEIKELFGSQGNRDLLNRVAPSFFGDVQRLFWNDLMLHATRLTDKRKDALKVQSLERFLKDEPDLLKQVEEHREAAVMDAMPVADWRHREIAHRNRSLATGNSPEPLAKVKLETCKQVLDHVHAALDAISRRYMKSSIANHIAYSPRSGGFVAYLKEFVDSVQYIASIIDPNYADGFDSAKCRPFLEKLGRSEPDELYVQIFTLMHVARRCRIPRSE